MGTRPGAARIYGGTVNLSKVIGPPWRPNYLAVKILQMSTEDRRTHWETVYQTKDPESVSWYQPEPKPSLELFDSLKLEPNAHILDVGGGDSRLADHLLHRGFSELTVLDLSQTALDRARKRLGPEGGKVRWIATDILDFEPNQPIDLWHDRAAFHFLTDPKEVRDYLRILRRGLKPGGYLILGTFSTEGPERCSGLPVQQYSAQGLQALLGPGFSPLRCFLRDHVTPGGGRQNFLYCLFQRQPAETVN